MIGYLAGKIRQRTPSGVVVDCHGVGYRVELPLQDLAAIGAMDTQVELWVHTRVREDSLELYGFFQPSDKDVFEILLGITGVGPKVGLAIISTLSAGQIYAAATHGDPEPFVTVPGIGRRTAEKIIFELNGRMDKLPAAAKVEGGPQSLKFGKSADDMNQSRKDLRSALQNLGFKDKEINPILTQIEKSPDHRDFPSMVREALRLLKIKKPVTRGHRSPASENLEIF